MDKRLKKKLVLKTWDEWEAQGYHVIKGQKAMAFNKRNIALFDINQVTKTIYRDRYGYDYTMNQAAMQCGTGDQPKTVYFADGSGYVDFGGPCGPLYFDRNGNT